MVPQEVNGAREVKEERVVRKVKSARKGLFRGGPRVGVPTKRLGSLKKRLAQHTTRQISQRSQSRGMR